MNFIKSRLNKKGFTLVELLIVIAVLGIIAGIGVNQMTGITDTFKVKADKETARIFARQVEVMILAGEVDGDTSVADLNAALKSDFDSAKPQSLGEYAVSEFEITAAAGDTPASASITITFGTKNPKDFEEFTLAGTTVK